MFATAAHAIPSPELVIGSISSLSQIVAMGFAMLGGLSAAVAARFGIKIGGSGQNGVWMARGLLAVTLVAAGLGAANIYQYQKQKQTEMVRLQATLNRPAQFDGTRIQDSSLVETSFADQTKSQLSITTSDAEALFKQAEAGDDSIVFLDIRESAENSMGTIPGTGHKRFPDIGSGAELAGKQVVLFCHNGNRSSETCARLAELGIDCRFISGGIEKWIVEGRGFSDPTVRGLSDLRAIPDYANKDVLLSTDVVSPMIASGEVQIIDARYPGDFAVGHLPGAVNIPLRAMPSADLATAIAGLDDRPILAACYDRRSCFMGQVLGHELTNAGHEFLGRYTLPWEYFTPKQPKPHIAAWMEAQNKTLWQKTVESIAGWLTLLAAVIGAVATIIVVSLISRLAVLPISIKSERDQITNAAIKPEVDALKSRLKPHPQRMARALRQVNRKYGLTPSRNLLALLFLPLMMLGLSSVQVFAETQTGGFWWNPSLADPDRLYLMPAVFAILAGIYLHVTIAKTKRARLISWGLAVPALGALAVPLSLAGSFYLVVSLTLLLVQRAVIVGWVNDLTQATVHGWQTLLIATLHRGIVPLRYHQHLTGAGNKSYRLSVLQSLQIKVPDGVVLTSGFLKRYQTASPSRQGQLLNRIWTMVGASEVAVRSSAAAEDGESMSFAGVFESKLHVTQSNLGEAISDVLASFVADKAAAYDGVVAGDRGGNILIHRMVDAEYSGVLFTQHPNAPGLAMAEMVAGTADDLVSGRVTPTVHEFGRFTHRPTAIQATPLDLAPLLRIGQLAEQAFGAPQDIEWTFRDGAFEIVQSRDITTLNAQEASTQDAMWNGLFVRFGDADPDEVVLVQDEMSEVLPAPTPLSLSYMQSVWNSGGSVDLACRKLGMEYKVSELSGCHLTTVFGRLYSDQRRKVAQSVVIPKHVQKKLHRNPMDIANAFQTEFLPRFEIEMQRLDAVAFENLPTDMLQAEVQTLFKRYIEDVNAEVEVVNIAADFYLAQTQQECDALGYVLADHLETKVDKGPNAILRAAVDIPEDQRQDWILTQMGHRAIFDYELSDPRYSETPTLLSGMVLNRPTRVKPAEDKTEAPALPAGVQAALDIAHCYTSLKEEAKHAATRLLAQMRRSLLALDGRLGAEGLCFYLTVSELAEEIDGEFDHLREQGRKRRQKHRENLSQTALGAALSLADLERASDPMGAEVVVDGLIKGQRVSGQGPDIGQVFVVPQDAKSADAAMQGFVAGDIIVCEMVHPAWLPQVLEASAVVASVGGWLSHMAIVAREHDVSMIVNVKGTRAIGDRDRICIALDGSIEVLQEHVAEPVAAGRAVS